MQFVKLLSRNSRILARTSVGPYVRSQSTGSIVLARHNSSSTAKDLKNKVKEQLENASKHLGKKMADGIEMTEDASKKVTKAASDTAKTMNQKFENVEEAAGMRAHEDTIDDAKNPFRNNNNDGTKPHNQANKG